MSSGIVYRIRGDDELSHAYVSPYKNATTFNYKSTSVSERYGTKLNKIIGNKIPKHRYGQYSSPYYDPVARHERYLRERSKLGVGKSNSLGSSKGRSGGSGGSGKSGGAKAKVGKGNNAAKLSAAVQAIREESQLNTEAQQEATRRKIADLKAQLIEQVNALRNKKPDELSEEGLNTAEIRGKIQSLKEQIQSSGGDLQTWISKERDALEHRIAVAYKKNGQKYNTVTKADRSKAAKKREKEVASRADSIYKSKKK